MHTQKSFWLKPLIASLVIIAVSYWLTQPIPTDKKSPQDAYANTNTNTNNQDESLNKEPIKNTVITSSATSSASQLNHTAPITPELQERLNIMQARRPNQQFSPEAVAAAMERTSSWMPTESVYRDLPLAENEFEDGRQFVEFDSLKMETLMPGDQINIQVDEHSKDYQVTIDRIEQHDYNSISWFGHIEGDDGQTYHVSFTRGDYLTVGGLDTPEGHFVIQAHGDKGWIASSQLLFKQDTSISDAINPADIDSNYRQQEHAH
jgi:hypothetical protein